MSKSGTIFKNLDFIVLDLIKHPIINNINDKIVKIVTKIKAYLKIIKNIYEIILSILFTYVSDI